MKTHDWRSERSGRRLRFEGSVAAVRSSPRMWPGVGVQRTLRGNGREADWEKQKKVLQINNPPLAVGEIQPPMMEYMDV